LGIVLGICTKILVNAAEFGGPGLKLEIAHEELLYCECWETLVLAERAKGEIVHHVFAVVF
jgi:hypothetical protein